MRVVHYEGVSWRNGKAIPLCRPYSRGWGDGPQVRGDGPGWPEVTLDATQVTCKACLQRKIVRMALAQPWPDVHRMSGSFRFPEAAWREKRSLIIRTRALSRDEVAVLTDLLMERAANYLQPPPAEE